MIKIINDSDLTGDWYYASAASDKDITDTVSLVIDDVKKHGDEALIRLTKQFDKVDIQNFLISEDELRTAYEDTKVAEPSLIAALEYAKSNITSFAIKQRECFSDFETQVTKGVFASQKTIPIERAGVYIPAGRYPLVSTVLMNVIPALVAGVKEIALCTPPARLVLDSEQQGLSCATQQAGRNISDAPCYKANRNILAAAYLCGLKKAYAVGGAQAVAAMAYGTSTIPKCALIVGPGNAFVAEAKKQVYGTCGIDFVAGPTEVLIIAGGSQCNAQSYEARSERDLMCRLVAADMLSQAEHDVRAQAVLLTADKDFALMVQKELDEQLATLPTTPVARASIDKNGAIVICDTYDKAAEIANIKAPEHLELFIADKAIQERVSRLVHNYGSLFLSPCAEVFGDYAAGVNHTLPTMGAARYTGGLSVRMFLKTATVLRCNECADLSQLAASSSILAESEGLIAHKRAADARVK